jgi:hypothetical protein
VVRQGGPAEMTHEEAIALADEVTRAGFAIFLKGASRDAYEARESVDGSRLDWEADISIKGASKSLDRIRDLIDLLERRGIASSLQEDEYIHVA